MNGEGAAFLQHTQGFQQNGLSVAARDVVIDIIAGHRIESLVGKVKLQCVAMAEMGITHTLGLCVLFA